MIILFLLTGILLSERILSGIYKAKWDDNLQIKVRFQDQVISEGAEGYVVEELENRKRIPIPLITIAFHMDKHIEYHESKSASVSDKSYRNDIMSIRGNQKLVRRFLVTYRKRGLYFIEDINVRSKTLLGSNYHLTNMTNQTQIYVYPSYSPRKEILTPFSRTLGEALQSRFLYEDPFEFKGIRDYTGVEPMRKINWRASAKTNSLKVNQYYDTTCRNVTVFLDIANQLVRQYDDLLEESIRIVRNYLEGFYHNHVPMTLITNALDCVEGSVLCFEEGLGAGYMEDCLKKLARIDLTKKTTPIMEYLQDKKAARDQLTILISIDSSKDLVKKFQSYLGNTSGEWIFLHRGVVESKIQSPSIHVTYVEVV